MSDRIDSYEVLAGPGRAERKIQRSRFLAEAWPAPDPAAALGVVADLRRRYHDARHVCHAWRLGCDGEGGEIRNDDGEPSGTAGEPILLAIRGAGLTDTVVAVVRYFGGVKLGTGGLARAYGGVAAAALEVTPRRVVRLGRTYELTLDYAQQKTVRHLLTGCGGEVTGEDYAALVRWRLWLPRSRCDEFTRLVREATAGQLDPRPLDDA